MQKLSIFSLSSSSTEQISFILHLFLHLCDFFFLPALNNSEITTLQDAYRRLLVISQCTNLVRVTYYVHWTNREVWPSPPNRKVPLINPPCFSQKFKTVMWKAVKELLKLNLTMRGKSLYLKINWWNLIFAVARTRDVHINSSPCWWGSYFLHVKRLPRKLNYISKRFKKEHINLMCQTPVWMVLFRSSLYLSQLHPEAMLPYPKALAKRHKLSRYSWRNRKYQRMRRIIPH